MLPSLPLLLLLLPTAQALPMQEVPAPAQRQLKGVPMNGHCAVVSHHDSWEDDATGMVCCADCPNRPSCLAIAPPNLTPTAACAADVVVSDQGVAVVCVWHRQVVH